MSVPYGPGSYASGSSAYDGPPTHAVASDMTCVGGVLSHAPASMHTTAPPAAPVSSSSSETLNHLLKLVGGSSGTGASPVATGTSTSQPSMIDSFAHSLLGTKDKTGKKDKKEKKQKGVMADMAAVQAFAAHHSDADLQRLLKLMLTGKSLTEALIALGAQPVAHTY
jgi:hypothetical protein